MFSSDDTIVAIATPQGRGGIGVVRVSGPSATDIASRILTRPGPLSPRYATLTRVRVEIAGTERAGDEVIVTWFPAPHSYTGEDVVEISAHGSPVILRAILMALVTAGARLARPGEFTFRAFLNARVDLAQAEAVADLIDAATPLQAQVAFDQLQGTLSGRISAFDQVLLDLVARLEASLDFPDEGFHFVEPDVVADRIGEVLEHLRDVLANAARARLIREGATVVITGRVNAGKSSLFNAVVGQQRAIVNDCPGTTRDLLTETIDLDGLQLTLVDTAGVRETIDVVELEGAARAAAARRVADLTLLVIDSGEDLTHEDERLLEEVSGPRLVVASKADRESRWEIDGALRVSTCDGTGLRALKQAVCDALMRDDRLRDTAAIANVRHVSLLKEAASKLERAHAAAREAAPEEIVLVDLHQARASLAEVVGVGASDETLSYIFSHFCIGK